MGNPYDLNIIKNLTENIQNLSSTEQEDKAENDLLKRR